MKGPARIAVLLSLPVLAACATVPPPPPPPAPVPDYGVPAFIAAQRQEARRLESGADLASARLRWRYVGALAPGDEEAELEIARLDGLIRARIAALIAQGETAMMRGRAAEAQTAFLKALALDGENEQARRRLREIDVAAAFARQERRDREALAAARPAGTEAPN